MLPATKSSNTVGIDDIFRLSWPIMIGMFAQTFMGIFDVLIVADRGTTAIAAMALAVPWSFMPLLMIEGVLRGAQVLAAQRMGAEDRAGAETLLWPTLRLSLLIGIPIALLGLTFPAIALWGLDSPELAKLAGWHVAIRLLGTPLRGIFVGMMGWLRGMGNPRTAMIAQLSANVTYVVLGAALVRGWGPFPEWGVLGTAISSVISWVIGAAAVLWAVRRELRRNAPLGNAPEVWAIGAIGFPLGMQHLFDVAGFAVFSLVLVSTGEAHLAAHMMAARIISVSFLPGYAIGEAAGVLVGNAIGAKDSARARQSWALATRVAIAIMMFWAVCFALFPNALIAPFNAAFEVNLIAHDLLWIAAAFQLLDAVATVALGALVGAGDTRFTLVLNLLVGWGAKIPLGVFLAVVLHLGAQGVWLGFVLEIGLLAAIAVWRIRQHPQFRALEPAIA